MEGGKERGHNNNTQNARNVGVVSSYWRFRRKRRLKRAWKIRTTFTHNRRHAQRQQMTKQKTTTPPSTTQRQCQQQRRCTLASEWRAVISRSTTNLVINIINTYCVGIHDHNCIISPAHNFIISSAVYGILYTTHSW